MCNFIERSFIDLELVMSEIFVIDEPSKYVPRLSAKFCKLILSITETQSPGSRHLVSYK